jgi:hypothetical protein
MKLQLSQPEGNSVAGVDAVALAVDTNVSARALAAVGAADAAHSA